MSFDPNLRALSRGSWLVLGLLVTTANTALVGCGDDDTVVTPLDASPSAEGGSDGASDVPSSDSLPIASGDAKGDALGDDVTPGDSAMADGGPQLIGRAVLPAATLAPGPRSGANISPDPTTGFNGFDLRPYEGQPVQGFSAVLDNHDGTFMVMADNGYGSIENSADFNLRVYVIRPDFKTGPTTGTGTIGVMSWLELHDPDKKIPFAIVHHFSAARVLTGADFDIESLQRAPDGTLWFGDEFGPFLLHTDAKGKVLEAPIPLPDFAHPGKELRSPQNPFSEESSALRVMNAFRAHAQSFGNTRAPVFSPWHVMLDDGDPTTVTGEREVVPAGSGLATASSDVFSVASLKAAGFPVVVWTVNDLQRMKDLIDPNRKVGDKAAPLMVNGIISDRPDLLFQAVASIDGNADGKPDYLDADGLIDITKVDAQGHRGGRGLRPENTLPAMEVALDNLMTTLELDLGLTKDGVLLLSHDPHLTTNRCRRSDGGAYTTPILIKDYTALELQTNYVCDLNPNPTGMPEQRAAATSDVVPVSTSFIAGKLPSLYAQPTMQQVFDFVKAYQAYYATGLGSTHPQAAKRAKNAGRVRFNIETKVNPRAAFDFTRPADDFASATGALVMSNGLADRVDIQSFDFRTLKYVQENYPRIRTVYLFGDFPVWNGGGDDGTNLQPEGTANTPWLAGLFWPYRVTRVSQPFDVERSAGFEGMALDSTGTKLYPMLEKPLVGGEAKTLLVHEFDLLSKTFTQGVFAKYVLDEKGTNIGDFIMISADSGLVIEREGGQGPASTHKKIYQIKLAERGAQVTKQPILDLLDIADPRGITAPTTGDYGLGPVFAFPFTTIEDVVLLSNHTIGVLNDNNFPFSRGRHVDSKLADDNEFIVVDIGRSLLP